MARLSDPSAPVRPVPRQVGGIAQLRAVGPSGAEGEGMVRAGAQIEAGAEVVMQEQKVEEQRLDTLRAEEAYTKLRDQQLDLSIGEQNGFAHIRSSAAVSRPILKEWSKKFDDAEQQITSGLSNDEQRRKFKMRADVSRIQFKEDILRHLSKEGDVYAKEVYDGALHVEERNAVARWDSPNDIQSSLERIKHQVDERGDRLGWTDEYRKSVLQVESGKVHSAVIGQAIASKNFNYAKAWYDAHKEDVDAPTAKALEKAVLDSTQKELTNRYNADYLASDGNYQGLEALRKRVAGDAGLDEDRRNILIGRIQTRQSVLEHRFEVARDRRERMVQRGVDQLNSNTLAGFEPTPEQFAPLLAVTKGTAQEGEVRSAIQLADATRSFRTATPLQQEQMLTTAEAGVRNEPTKFDRRIVGAWRTIYDSQRRQVQDNPISFAVRQGITEAPQPLDLSNPGAASAALHERFALARGVAQRYQAPFKPLTDQEVGVLRATLEGATVEQKRNYFSSLASAAGGDTQGYMGVMAQLAPDDPVTAIAGSQAARGRNAEADLILRGQAILRPSKKSDGHPDGNSLLPMPKEQDLRLKFDSVVRDAFAGRPEARSGSYQAARAAYAALSIDAGDRDTAVLNSDRWDKAIEVAVGKVENYRGRRMVLPAGYDYSQFRDDLGPRLAEVVRSGDLEPSWTLPRLRDLPMENIGDGRYILRSGDGIVVTKKGEPVIINFNRGTPTAEIPAPPTPEEVSAAEQPYLGSPPKKRAKKP